MEYRRGRIGSACHDRGWMGSEERHVRGPHASLICGCRRERLQPSSTHLAPRRRARARLPRRSQRARDARDVDPVLHRLDGQAVHGGGDHAARGAGAPRPERPAGPASRAGVAVGLQQRRVRPAGCDPRARDGQALRGGVSRADLRARGNAGDVTSLRLLARDRGAGLAVRTRNGETYVASSSSSPVGMGVGRSCGADAAHRPHASIGRIASSIRCVVCWCMPRML